MGQHFFWIVSRSAGIAALLLATASVTLGLAMGGKLVKKLGDVRVLHEALSLATLGAIVVHALALLGDSYMSPSLADITIPLASGYQTLWTSMGIVAGWVLAVLGLSYYARRRIGQQRWRTLHRFTALAWLASIAHALGEGTDASKPWFLLALGALAIPAFGFLFARLSEDRPTAVSPA
jgi:sulfoxide reductase heme-binding subunit YedZ